MFVYLYSNTSKYRGETIFIFVFQIIKYVFKKSLIIQHLILNFEIICKIIQMYMQQYVLAKTYMSWPRQKCVGQDMFVYILVSTYISWPRYTWRCLGQDIYVLAKIEMVWPGHIFLGLDRNILMFVNNYCIKCLFIYIRIPQNIEVKQFLYLYFK